MCIVSWPARVEWLCVLTVLSIVNVQGAIAIVVERITEGDCCCNNSGSNNPRQIPVPYPSRTRLAANDKSKEVSLGISNDTRLYDGVHLLSMPHFLLPAMAFHFAPHGRVLYFHHTITGASHSDHLSTDRYLSNEESV